MEKKIKEFIKNNYKYITIILTIIVIISLLIYSYFYSNKVEEKVESQEKIIVEKEEKIKDEKKYIKVDIKGHVKKAGVYELEEGSRVIDVINRAGGLLKDADTSLINLSKNLTDEMVIIIYSKNEIEEYRKEKEVIKYVEVEVDCDCPDNMNDACINKSDEKTEINKTGKENEETEENKKISINTATSSELQSLTGVGESKANSIISYREENGGFKTIEEIMNVSGIGESLFEKIKDNITI